jgi:hypothetical protein
MIGGLDWVGIWVRLRSGIAVWVVNGRMWIDDWRDVDVVDGGVLGKEK